MTEKKQGGRVPDVVGSIPVIGNLARSVDEQLQVTRDILDQQSRMVAQIPVTMKNLNDAIERFNQTVERLDRTLTKIDSVATALMTPIERLSNAFDSSRFAEVPDLMDVIRKEAVPALRAATDTQRQVALLQATFDRVVAIISELPGAGLVKRMSGGRAESAAAAAPPPAGSATD